MIFGLSPGDQLAIGYIKWVSAIVIVVSPWLFLRIEMKAAKIALTAFWILGILTLSLLYLGFLVDTYMGPQLGFNHRGNSMNWFMIVVGLFSAMPFVLSAKNGKLDNPFRTAILVTIAMLILIGPPIYNSVALGAYGLGGGEWDGGEGDYAGEEYDPTEPEIWSRAGYVGLFVCNLVPTAILVGIWQLARASKSDMENAGTDNNLSREA